MFIHVVFQKALRKVSEDQPESITAVFLLHTDGCQYVPTEKKDEEEEDLPPIIVDEDDGNGAADEE